MNKLFGKYSRSLFHPLLAGLLFSGLLAACEAEESCFSFATNEYQLGFYVRNANGRTQAGPFNFREVEVVGSDSTYFVPQATGINSLRLALNPAADTTTFVFRYDAQRDTLKVAYKRTFRMISPDCGMEVLYSDLNAFYHTFDSVRNLTTELSRTDAGFDLAVYSLETCPSPFVSLFRSGFHARNENGEFGPDVVNFDSVQAIGNDSLFYTRTEAGIDRLDLALNPTADSTAFLFNNEGQVDTLVVKYTREPRIFSPGCGYETTYVNLSVAQSTFDSVSLISNSIPETATRNFDVEIFRFE